MYKNFFKLTLDFLVALIGLLVLLPIFLFVMIGLAIANNGKPFFFQKRPGKNEKIFSIIKFKTMNDKKDAEGNLLSDAERLTKIGSFVRKTSLDEIPQLINVLKGDMSLIGPRPLLVSYLPYYTKRENLRHTVRPGITGLAQISGRNTINWDERLELDAQYVENLSFKNDLLIFLQTIKSVINRRDIVVIPGEMFTTLDKYREIEKMFKLKAKYFDKKDISTKVLWMNDKRINHQMFFDLPATVENTQKWFEHNIGNKNRVDFSFITNGSYVAMGGFTNIDHIANHAEFYVMVNPEMHGKGIGGKVSYWMYNYAFVKLNLNKIYLYTNKDNVSAYKIYERAGFKLEGVLRQHKYKKGVLLDRRFYGLLREEWELQNWSKKELSYELD